MQIRFIMIACNVNFTTGKRAPYHITYPPTNNEVQFVFPNVTRMNLSCVLNANIPSSMIITWLHNGEVLNLTTEKEQANDIATLITNTQPSDAGVYQCVLNYTAIGYTLRRNITLLSM